MGRLGEFEPKAQVVMPGEDDDFCIVSSAFEDLAHLSGGAVQLSDERSPGYERVVRLFGPEAP